jgi:hypothetical protein
MATEDNIKSLNYLLNKYHFCKYQDEDGNDKYREELSPGVFIIISVSKKNNIDILYNNGKEETMICPSFNKDNDAEMIDNFIKKQHKQ